MFLIRFQKIEEGIYVLGKVSCVSDLWFVQGQLAKKIEKYKIAIPHCQRLRSRCLGLNPKNPHPHRKRSESSHCS